MTPDALLQQQRQLLQEQLQRGEIDQATYDRMLAQLRAARVKIDSIARDADGLDLAAARRLFGRSPPSAIHSVPIATH